MAPDDKIINDHRELLLAMSYKALATKEKHETIRTLAISVAFICGVLAILWYHHSMFNELLLQGIETTSEVIEVTSDVSADNNTNHSGDINVIGVTNGNEN